MQEHLAKWLTKHIKNQPNHLIQLFYTKSLTVLITSTRKNLFTEILNLKTFWFLWMGSNSNCLISVWANESASETPVPWAELKVLYFGWHQNFRVTIEKQHQNGTFSPVAASFSFFSPGKMVTRLVTCWRIFFDCRLCSSIVALAN